MTRWWWTVPTATFLIFLFKCVPISFGTEGDESDKMPSDQVKTYTWQDKLKRGALNVVSSPVEVARSIHTTTEEKDLLNGWTVGLAKGTGDGLIRLGAGTVDLLTFPFAFPDHNRGSLIAPEYVWQKGGLKYS